MHKAIDTEYGGILYRSRLEAMWAEFFDQNQIRHKYEFIKVDLGTDKYTPDFWLPEFGLWVEIKPFRQYRPHSKCYRLAIETRRHVLLIQGKPEKHVVDLFDPNVRKKFSFRTVVKEGEAKPSKEFFALREGFVREDGLILTSSTTDETIHFVRER
ncbi:MAG TPA: hypothetical protein EYN91_13045 [Candidatus Melainabacteria bacterium]|nr:hypothetical protein [Candidatus Melainabacteria bacterium]HIN64779.1 hypothetical protein [Candidatus Obscuribacterales bacterium]